MKIVKISKPIVIAGKLFRTNEEYPWKENIVKMEGCNCNGTSSKSVLYYRINVGGKDYDIHNKNSTVVNKVDVEVNLSPEQYHTTLRGTTFGGMDDRDYDEIREKPDFDRIYKSVNEVRL